MMFDFRGPGANPKAPVPEQDNTLALVHETIHQLTFNTGVLDLKADVPLCVIEGLATYGETWRPRHRGEIGADQRPPPAGARTRPQAGGRAGSPWRRSWPRTSCSTTRRPQQVAYAESWMFVHKLMQGPGPAPEVPGLPRGPPGEARPGPAGRAGDGPPRRPRQARPGDPDGALIAWGRLRGRPARSDSAAGGRGQDRRPGGRPGPGIARRSGGRGERRLVADRDRGRRGGLAMS